MKILLATPLLLLLTPADAGLTLAPDGGTTVTKRFSSQVHLEGGELTVVMDGQEVPSDFLPDLELSFDDLREVSFSDHYLRAADGRVLELVREFGQLSDSHEFSQSVYGGGMDSDSEGNVSGDSALEGQRVRFVWDGEEQAYEASFVQEGDGAADAQLLEGLSASADLAGFLPQEKVSRGDTWSVSGAAIAELLTAGGDLGFVYEGDDEDKYNSDDSVVTYGGELEITFVGERSAGDAGVAILKVAGELVVESSRRTDLDDIPVVDGWGTERLRQVLTVEGEVLWNLDLGLPHAAEFSATIEAEAIVEAEDQDFSSTVTMTGEASFSASFEVAD